MHARKAEKSCSLRLLATTISQSPKTYGWITLEDKTDRIREEQFKISITGEKLLKVPTYGG